MLCALFAANAALLGWHTVRLMPQTASLIALALAAARDYPDLTILPMTGYASASGRTGSTR